MPVPVPCQNLGLNILQFPDVAAFMPACISCITGQETIFGQSENFPEHHVSRCFLFPAERRHPSVLSLIVAPSRHLAPFSHRYGLRCSYLVLPYRSGRVDMVALRADLSSALPGSLVAVQ